MAKRAAKGEGGGRKRAAKAKAEPNPRATAGHNEDAVQAAFLRHKPQWIAQQAKIDAAKLQQKSIEKAAQLEGVEPKCFRDAQKLAGATGERDLQRDVERRLGVARWLGLAIGTQMSMFAGHEQSNPSRRMADAYSAGKSAGLSGTIPCKAPGELAQEEQQQWIAGWQEGQGSLAKGFKRHDPTEDLASSMQPGGAPEPDAAADDGVNDERDVEEAGTEPSRLN